MFLILKEFVTPTYIGDFYILTQSKSKYFYVASENVDVLSLTQGFLVEHIFGKYPQLKNEMIAEAKIRYTH